MATAMLISDASPTSRRREIEEWHSSLATRTDAEILQIPTGATPAQVKAAFASLARRFHPDSVAAGEDDLRHQLQSIFIRVTEAYRNLGRERSSTPASAAPPSLQDTAVRRARVEEALQAAGGLMLQQQTEEAVSVLHEVLTQADAPQSRRIRLLLARAYAVDARWRRNAVTLLRELVEQNSNDAEALAALGGLYRRDGLLSRAESMFVRALAADPGLAEARQGMRSVRSALLAKHTPSRTKPAPRRGLMSRLFLVTR
jgi:tetratricopeptide (TPR) repeat protein